MGKTGGNPDLVCKKYISQRYSSKDLLDTLEHIINQNSMPQIPSLESNGNIFTFDKENELFTSFFQIQTLLNN